MHTLVAVDVDAERRTRRRGALTGRRRRRVGRFLAFGGRVTPGVDNRWCSHVSLPKTALQLLGLPALGVPRVDSDAGLADLVDPAHHTPPPPRFSTNITQPAPPTPTPAPKPPPSPGGPSVPVGPVLLRDGTTLPPPNDVPLTPKHPHASPQLSSQP